MEVLSKSCAYCGRIFNKPRSCGMPEWKTRRFCSPRCAYNARRGLEPWNKGKSFAKNAQRLPCRICGKPTRYHGSTSNHLYGKVHCDDPQCIEASRQLKNSRISETQKRLVASGKKRPSSGWHNVRRISQEERVLQPYLEALGWMSQFRFNTGVHSFRLPRQFILDFADPASKLYIEIDGDVHRLRKERDLRRDTMMAERGWRGLRIPAKTVRDDHEKVLSTIMAWIASQC